MSQAQKASATGMEDLLASIRKAIDEDFATQASPSEGGAITGSMREFRVRLDGAKPAGGEAEPEILELRDRIAVQLTERADLQPPKRNGFAGILSGAAGLPNSSSQKSSPPPPTHEERPSPPSPPWLRRGYNDLEPEPIARKPPPAEPPRIESPKPQVLPRAGDGRVQPAALPAEPGRPLASYARVARALEPNRMSLPPIAEETPSRAAADNHLLSPLPAASAEAAFSRLAESLLHRTQGQRPMEEITRDLLRPMLKQWLDDHLSSLVERLVRAEIERVARRGGR